eukprot:779457-Pelagomonas_calceolata.AAC.2
MPSAMGAQGACLTSFWPVEHLNDVHLLVASMQRGEARARLAISDFNSGDIYVYDARSGSSEPIHVHKVGQSPVQPYFVAKTDILRTPLMSLPGALVAWRLACHMWKSVPHVRPPTPVLYPALCQPAHFCSF